MTTPKYELRVRVLAKGQNAEDIKLLCRELLLEARTHDIAGIEFDLWLQAYHIVRKKLPLTISAGPLATNVPYWIGPDGSLITAHNSRPEDVLNKAYLDARLRNMCGEVDQDLLDEVFGKDPTDPKLDNQTGMRWIFEISVIAWAGVAVGAIFMLLWD